MLESDKAEITKIAVVGPLVIVGVATLFTCGTIFLNFDRILEHFRSVRSLECKLTLVRGNLKDPDKINRICGKNSPL